MTNDLLIEIGTEELPPKSLKQLSGAFGENVHAQFEEQELSFSQLKTFATPRRLAILVSDLQSAQPDKVVDRRGPALQAAFDEQGEPTRAATGFASSCGVDVSDLDRLETDKGTWLAYQLNEPGKATVELIPTIVTIALNKLPIPKRMRWGRRDVAFVRPVHWVVMLFGEQIIKADILGIQSGNETFGHRFHHPQAIRIKKTSDYQAQLQNEGYVIVDFEQRRDLISKQVESIASELDGKVILDPALLDEVTSLVEWPVALSGEFDQTFLELPDEVLISTMKGHQKYFHVLDQKGKLLPNFITVSNIQSHHPETVKEGNERVIRPRLSDSAHFWKTDLKTEFSVWQKALETVIFQNKLGTTAEKSIRVSQLAGLIAQQLGANVNWAERAGLLSKCDLMSDMVGEFPDLQGVMGRYYAQHRGEPDEVADALDEQYLPRFAGDKLPFSPTGQAVAIAEKLDTLVGIFGIGQAPTGVKDPFALRRAALGALRIILEQKLDLDLKELLSVAENQYSDLLTEDNVVEQVFEYMLERLRNYYADQGISIDIYAAVTARKPARPYDFDQRIHAVLAFKKLPEAESLAAANKRIGNILKKQSKQDALSSLGNQSLAQVDEALLQENAEQNLLQVLKQVQEKTEKLIPKGKYTEALAEMAVLRQPVDNFFDQVMVMCDDDVLKNNRLALLGQLRALFMKIADISQIQAKQQD